MIVNMLIGRKNGVFISIDLPFLPAKGMEFTFTCTHDDCGKASLGDAEITVYHVNYRFDEKTFYVFCDEEVDEDQISMGDEAASCIRKHPESIPGYIKGSVR